MEIPLSLNREVRVADCRFANDLDVEAISHWAERDNSGESMRVQDAAEYAGLAVDKHDFYKQAGRLAQSLAELKSMIQPDPHLEVGALLLVNAAWRQPTPQLGCAFIRRTWSHNLVIDFLTNDPALLRPGAESIRGIATGLLYFVFALADHIDAGRVWGEATDQSVGFYRRQFRHMEMGDQFDLTPAEQWHFLEKTRTQWSRTGQILNLELS